MHGTPIEISNEDREVKAGRLVELSPAAREMMAEVMGADHNYPIAPEGVPAFGSFMGCEPVPNYAGWWRLGKTVGGVPILLHYARSIDLGLMMVPGEITAKEGEPIEETWARDRFHIYAGDRLLQPNLTPAGAWQFIMGYGEGYIVGVAERARNTFQNRNETG